MTYPAASIASDRGQADASPAPRPGVQPGAAVYPSLPAVFDTGFLRIGGSGLGNCLFVYFHAVELAARTGARLLTPAWPNLGIGGLLRGDRRIRRYDCLFKPHEAEIGGIRKAWILGSRWSGRTVMPVGAAPGIPPRRGDGRLAVVTLQACGFGPLNDHRPMVRRRLIDVLARPPAQPPAWGARDYAAVHVRLGDFAPAAAARLDAVNTRLPMDWYAAAIAKVRQAEPDLPVLLFSDGHDHELAPLLALPGVRLERHDDDVSELLAMASARVFVGSNSTFSHWAAFLGEMPTIWATPPAERFVGAQVPVTVLERP